MRTRAAAIITYNNSLIVIKRVKGHNENKEEYYTIPGGGQEEGETIEEAALREVMEELGIEIELTNICYKVEDDFGKQYYFVARYKSGEIGSGKGEEMTNIDYEKYGAYIPQVISKEDFQNIRLLPEKIKNIIIEDMNIIFS